MAQSVELCTSLASSSQSASRRRTANPSRSGRSSQAAALIWLPCRVALLPTSPKAIGLGAKLKAYIIALRLLIALVIKLNDDLCPHIHPPGRSISEVGGVGHVYCHHGQIADAKRFGQLPRVGNELRGQYIWQQAQYSLLKVDHDERNPLVNAGHGHDALALLRARTICRISFS